MSLFGARKRGRWKSLHELFRQDTGGWRCKHCREWFSWEMEKHGTMSICTGATRKPIDWVFVVAALAGIACAVSSLVGCASVVPYSRAPMACQDRAVITVWTLYEREDVPPQIWWVPRARQNCGAARPNGARGFMTLDGVCAGGNSWGDGMNLVDYGEGWEYTALAHELAHVALTRNGTPDPDHHSPMFQPGGAVARANAALAAAHLCGP